MGLLNERMGNLLDPLVEASNDGFQPQQLSGVLSVAIAVRGRMMRSRLRFDDS